MNDVAFRESVLAALSLACFIGALGAQAVEAQAGPGGDLVSPDRPAAKGENDDQGAPPAKPTSNGAGGDPDGERDRTSGDEPVPTDVPTTVHHDAKTAGAGSSASEEGANATDAETRVDATAEGADAEASLSQTEIKELKPLVRGSSVFAVGFSVGVRYRVSQEVVLQDVTISPQDGVLRGTIIDPIDTVVSVVLGVFPFKSGPRPKSYLDRLGAIINVDLATYGPVQGASISLFNQSVSGGVGLAYLLGDGSAAIGVTYERASARVARRGTVLGEPLVETSSGGQATQLTSVDLSDDRYFQDQATSGVSLKLILFL